MTRMPLRVQPRLLWTAIFGSLLLVNSQVQAGGPGGPGETGGAVAGGGVAASAGGARASGGERAGAPAESGRAVQAGPVLRAAPAVQAGANGRVAVANQGVVRGGENVAGSREVGVSGGGAAHQHYALHYGNPWTDPAGTGQRQHYYSTPLVNNRLGAGRGSRLYPPYLYQFYGGYYPIYVDAPYGGGYYDGDATVDTGYDGGPAAVPDPGAGPGPGVPSSNFTVSPQADGVQPTGDGSAAPGSATAPAGNGNPGAAAPSADHTPNPAIGPDSLVEAVQAELTKRGYFQGKVDAMFRPDTEAALRKFQQDNYLAPTGHLNEPTLHALNLD